MASSFIKNGVYVNNPKGGECTYLLRAIGYPANPNFKVEQVQFLVENGASLNTLVADYDIRKITHLCNAASLTANFARHIDYHEDVKDSYDRGREIMRILLEAGANPNLANGNGRVPLLDSLLYGDIETAKDLVVFGATKDSLIQSMRSGIDDNNRPAASFTEEQVIASFMEMVRKVFDGYHRGEPYSAFTQLAGQERIEEGKKDAELLKEIQAFISDPVVYTLAAHLVDAGADVANGLNDSRRIEIRGNPNALRSEASLTQDIMHLLKNRFQAEVEKSGDFIKINKIDSYRHTLETFDRAVEEARRRSTPDFP